MPKTLIAASNGNQPNQIILDDVNVLAIAELFCDTLQGEGVTAGTISTFMRLQGCTLKCKWCDTLEVWPYGDEYTFKHICELFESVGLIGRLANGQHLILTGGSPLKQQDSLRRFIEYFIMTYNFKPYIEVENECVLYPTEFFAAYVNQWNNSPKLSNSGMKEAARYKPDIIKLTAQLPNSWFKFVVSGHDCWNEIRKYFIDANLISRNQIILMPEGATQAELALTRECVADMAIREGVRFSDRLHVTIWDKKTGV